MSPESEQALATLRRMARGHGGASPGERAAFDLLKNFEDSARVDMAECLVRLDSRGRNAVLQLLTDLAAGRTGLNELR